MGHHDRPDTTADRSMHRREVLRAAVAATAMGAFGCVGPRDEGSGPAAAVRHGRIRQAIVGWPYMVYGEQWDLRRLCAVARDLGCQALDLVGPEAWPTLREYGLTCAVSPNGMPDPPFLMGLNNPRYQDEVIARTRRRIEECAQAGVSSVITFTGYKYRDATDPSSGEIPPDEGAANTVRGLKELAGDAERHGVTIVLEHLNSRVTDHEYKGHPGYQGDDIDYCADIIRQVGSPRV
jgi:hypothetical protein